MSEDKTFLFSPFDIKDWDYDEVHARYKYLQSKVYDNPISPYEVACNIENLANQNYLLGEMVARFDYEVSMFKAKIDKDYAVKVYEERDKWMVEHDSKPPAMAYFEALAEGNIFELRRELAAKQSDLKRFKIAYDSIENIMNAAKKKLEAMRHEEGNS